ncbi:MAG: M20 family peptidase [Candidatus Hydrogenedentes bacterium]|nr:M20 family peptidase [Candidatus Hydrogenedentota bacterium]
MKKKLALGILLFLLAMALLFVARTAAFQSRQIAVTPAPALPLDANALATRLAGAVQIPTISHQDRAALDPNAFLAFHRYLETHFPRVHATLQREAVNTYSLLYTWPGTDAAAPPILLIAHMDVVPIEPGTESDWEQPPFSGAIQDGYIWGRGTLDDKASVLGLLEAVEYLLTQGVTPQRTVLLGFGHDEEVGGEQGAKQIAALLKSRNVAPEFVLDEGMAIVEGLIPGITVPVGLIGIAEKGYLSVELIAESAGGHSSQPPAETTVGILAAAIHALETHQMPANLNGPVRTMFDFLGPEMPFGMRMVFANADLLAPLLQSQLAASPATNASIRTTTAPTMLDAGIKDNVLPSHARAVVNFRILPGDTSESVLKHVQAVINDERVTAKPLAEGSEPSPISPVDSPAFALLQKTLRETTPEAIVAPGLVVGGTDSQHYAAITSGIYRFLPLWLTGPDLARIHGSNERIAIENYQRVAAFYTRLLQNAVSAQQQI